MEKIYDLHSIAFFFETHFPRSSPKAYEKACGKEIPIVITPRRAGDIAWSYADTALAKKLLNWEAESGLEKMCEDSWNFTVKNPEGII